jgi:hypothetical protein
MCGSTPVFATRKRSEAKRLWFERNDRTSHRPTVTPNHREEPGWKEVSLIYLLTDFSLPCRQPEYALTETTLLMNI